MKGFIKPILLSGLTLALIGPMPFAGAAPQKTDGQPAFSEKGPHKDRGVHLTEIMAPLIKPAIPAFPVNTKISTKKEIKTTVTAAANNNTKVKTHTVISKITKPITPVTPHNSSAVIESSPVIMASSSQAVQDNCSVSAWLDRAGNNPRYKVGEKMVINVQANSDLNVLVFNYDAKGKLTQIFPNDYQQSAYLKAGENVQIGGPDSPFDYEISGKGGTERIFVYAYPNGSSSPITVAMAPVPNSPFRAAEMSLEKYRELVNKAKVFSARGVKVVPKANYKLTSNSQNIPAANKIELTFQVDAK